MAVTKIKPIKSTLSKALDYIQNPDKTDGKMLVSSFGCSYETADIEFEFTIAQALDKGNNLAHHLIQSFAPGEALRERISGTRTRTVKTPKSQRSGINLLIDIQNCIKAQESKGYEQWAKIHNLKQAAKTLNFLTEHKIEQYADLTAKISEIAAASEQAADSLKAAEKRLADMAVLIKNVTTYQKTKPSYDAYRKAKNKDRYRTDHERAIILHEAAAKALQTAGIKKLPNLAALQAEYEQLQAQKEALYADYGKLKKQAKEYDVVKRNIDSILRQDKEPEREKETERG